MRLPRYAGSFGYSLDNTICLTSSGAARHAVYVLILPLPVKEKETFCCLKPFVRFLRIITKVPERQAENGECIYGITWYKCTGSDFIKKERVSVSVYYLRTFLSFAESITFSYKLI